MSACSDKIALVHALADGELDAANAQAIERHIAECANCRAEHAQIADMRAALKACNVAFVSPDRLRASIEAMLADADPQHLPVGSMAARRQTLRAPRLVFGWQWASGAVTGLAAGIALMIAFPQVQDVPAQNDLVAGHVRSLMASHLVDVQASDKHTVKPWFNGRIDFAPPVPDLSADGFPLSGGRLDFIEGRDVAELVYRRRLHVINVFVAPTRDAPAQIVAEEARNGYNIVRWTARDLTFSAVSDLNSKELRQFRERFIAVAMK